jgi:hypothetical protein
MDAIGVRHVVFTISRIVNEGLRVVDCWEYPLIASDYKRVYAPQHAAVPRAPGSERLGVWWSGKGERSGMPTHSAGQ